MRRSKQYQILLYCDEYFLKTTSNYKSIFLSQTSLPWQKVAFKKNYQNVSMWDSFKNLIATNTKVKTDFNLDPQFSNYVLKKN